jgi:hypothetical protein
MLALGKLKKKSLSFTAILFLALVIIFVKMPENVDRNSKRKIFDFVPCLLQTTLTYHRLCRKAVFIIWSECCHLPNSPNPVNSAGILEQSMGARNREEIGLLYRPARLHIGWRN